MIFINCLIENPAFDSQTKELLITSCSKFGSTCILPNSFFKEFFSKTEIIERLLLDIDKLRIVNFFFAYFYLPYFFRFIR